MLIVPFQEISNFGAQVIESFLTKQGYRVEILYFKERNQLEHEVSQRELDLAVDFVRTSNPLLVGLTVMSPFFQIAQNLTEKIKSQINAPVIWGGVHPTICPEDCIDIADICCIGEGEEPLRQILEHLKANGTIPSRSQNCWINNQGNITKNPVTYRCTDLDSIPHPVFTDENKYIIKNDQLINEDPYSSYVRRTGKYYFKSLRGCPFQCTYCGNKAIRDAFEKSGGSYLRKRSIDNVIDELKGALRIFPNINLISSYDETFISGNAYVKEFAEKYKKEINLPFSCCAVSSLLSEENISLMANAGLRGLNIGVEAFSEEIRKSVYRRNISNAEIAMKSNMVHKYGIFIMYDFIYDNPLETEKDIAICFWDLIVKLPRPCQFNNYSLSHLPKSELTELLLREGKISSNDVVGKSDKGLVQWKYTSNYKRNKKIVFWNIIYSLYGKQIKLRHRSFLVPGCLIKSIAFTESLFLAKILRKIVSIVIAISEGAFIHKVKIKIGFVR